MSTILIRKAAKFLVYLSLLTPLLVLPQYFVFPFVVPKAVFFRSLMILVGLAVLAIWLIEHKDIAQKQKIFTPLNIAVIFSLASLIISTVFSVDWRSSLWNNHERMLGVFTILHYFILFYAARYLFRSSAEWRNLFFVFSGVGSIVMLVAVAQKINPQLFWNRGEERVLATLGNAIYLAGFGLYLFFVGILCAKKEDGWQKWWFLASALLGLVGIFISNTRGTFLGLLGGLCFACLIYLWIKRKQLGNKCKIWIFISILALSALSVLAFTFKQTDFVRSVPLVGSVVGISPFEGSAKTRLMAWKVAGQGFVDHPIFGWGPNNYGYIFNKHYNPDFLQFGFQETWFDNAHNALFNTLATQGIFGLLGYVGVFAAAFLCIYRIYCLQPNKTAIVIWGGAFLLGHFIHNFFVFENLTSYLYFFLFLAFLDSQFYESSGLQAERNSTSGRISLPLLVCILVISVIIIFKTNVNVAVANNYTLNMLGYATVVGDYDKALNYYDKSIKWRSPYQDDINWEMGSIALDVLPNIYSKDEKLARLVYDLGQAGMEKFITRHPLDVRAYLVYSDLLRGGMVLFDLDNKSKVEEQLKIAENLAPGRQQIEFSKITFLAGIGGTDNMIASIKLAQEAVQKYPYSAESRYLLARLYVEARLFPYVLPVLDQAIDIGIVFADSVHLEFLAEAYEREGRFNDALYWLDRWYRITGDNLAMNRRDELSRLTQRPVPKSLEEFFKYRTSSFDSLTNFNLLK